MTSKIHDFHYIDHPQQDRENSLLQRHGNVYCYLVKSEMIKNMAMEGILSNKEKKN
jgi:hypothetical protein